MPKRGPKTDEGREVARLNAVQHGMTSSAALILGFESEEQWDAHIQNLRDSLLPEGSLEENLVDAIASTLWRMKRIPRYESAVLSTELGRARIDASHNLLADSRFKEVDVSEAVKAARAEREAVALLELEDGETVLSSEQVRTICGLASDALRTLYSRIDLTEFLAVVNDNEGNEDTVDELNEILESTVRENLYPHDSRVTLYIPGFLMQWADEQVNELERLEARLPGEVERIQADRGLLEDAKLNKVMRYEAHLRRQLVQYLHELEALQAKRQGSPVPLARLDITSDEASDTRQQIIEATRRSSPTGTSTDYT